MRSLIAILFFFIFAAADYSNTCEPQSIAPVNGCVNFSIGQGTGCQWMCQYCESQLGTSNYYFTADVCKYQAGGCVGNPQTGVTYTCCST